MKVTNKTELNFKCSRCGAGVYNATKLIKKCPVCGHDEILVVKPIGKGEENGS